MALQRKVIFIGVLLVAAIGTGVFAWNAASSTDPQFVTAKVVAGDLQQNVLSVGRLRPKELVAVGAQVSGQVKRLHVALGQSVKAGELIAEVDAQPQQIALRNAEAAVASLEAQLAARQASMVQAELAYRRQQTLMQGDATARADVEAAKAAMETARAEARSLSAQIQQARTQVETARTNLAYTRIVAPMDGVIVAIVTKQGQTLNSFQSTPTIVMLARLDVMTVRAEIAEADVGKVRPGQRVSFTTLGEARHHIARIEQIEPAPESIVNDAGGNTNSAAGAATQARAVYYNALFDVPNHEGRFRPSMTAQVTVMVDEVKQAVLVPTAALGERSQDGTFNVRVLDADERVSTRKVRIGLRTRTQAQVLAGLNVDDRVVLAEASPAASASPGTALFGF